ncbi:MAG TPA: hypothetical protein VK684_06265 [Edaphobacter sp.]|jgi:hypothetical protein|nr:hypothetical protein [Edaphobacter sp.]
MKHWRTAVFVCLILLCCGQVSLAQTVHGSTDLDIDPDTGIVTATCETDADYFVAEYYKVMVSCTVEDSNNNIVAAGGGSDDSGQGYVQAVVTFTGVPGETYTAMSAHSLFEIYTIEYYEDPPQPIRLHYYDDVYDFGFYADNPSTFDGSFSLESPGPETATVSEMQHTANTVVKKKYQNCPTSIVADPDTSLIPFLQAYVPTYLTGMGLIASMQVGPTTGNFDGTVLDEIVTASSIPNTCPTDLPSLTNSFVCSGGGHFNIGNGGGYMASGVQVPNIHNQFFDDHERFSTFSRLGGTEASSCTVVCAQTYTCNGKPIANFNITTQFTQGTSGGYPVTSVYVTKP